MSVSRKERIIKQRALVREAFGKLDAVSEMFGLDDETGSDNSGLEWEAFEEKLSEYRTWMFDEGPLA